MTVRNRVAAATISLMFGSTTTLAALLVPTVGTPVVMTFDEDVGDAGGGFESVFHFGSEQGLGLTEAQTFEAGFSDSANLITTSWALRVANNNLLGLPTNTRTTIGADGNGDGDQMDRSSVLDALARRTSITGNGIITQDRQRFASMDFTLLVQNTTGAEVSQWEFLIDTYFDDAAGNDGASVIDLSYSADNVSFTLLDTRTVDAPGGGTDGFDAADAATLETIGGTFNLSVPANGFLYLRLAYDAASVGGGWTGFGFDNWSVSAIPEPTTLALLSLALAAVARRRK